MTKSIEDYFTDWEGHVFGYGYGTGEVHTVPAVKRFMDAVGREDMPTAYDYARIEDGVGSPVVAWLLINTLCHAGIIEYGTSPRFGWLTPEGDALKTFIDGQTVGSLVDLTHRGEDYVPCYPNACNCGPEYDERRVCPNPFWKHT